MNKVLIITYYWPPSGGAGVQRWLKFAKYLPESGWEPFILTVDPQFAAYPVTDNSLTADIPSSLKVHSTRAVDYFNIYKRDRSKIPTAGFANSVEDTFKGKLLRFIRGNFFIPDPRKGWNRYAYKKACFLIEQEGIKDVITTSPPHSTQLIGLKIKKHYPAIKWIVDLRDPWTDIYYYKQFYPTLVSRLIDSGYERKVLRYADKIITVGESLKRAFSSKETGIENKIEVIPNGFDGDDFIESEACDPERFTITYTGTLSDIYPVDGLITALKILNDEGKDFLIRFVGTVSPKPRKLLMSEIPCASMEFISNVGHNKAIRYMMRSSVLMLIIPSHKSNKSIITGKLFEYLATAKPILCIGPVDGDAAEIIKKCKAGVAVDYNNSGKIADTLKAVTLTSGSHKTEFVSEFSRRNLARKVAAMLSTDN